MPACKEQEPNHPNTKMERLVQRLLEKRVIPFLGAGVSYTAKTDKGECPAVTHNLVCNLRNVIENWFQQSPPGPWRHWCYHTAVEHGDNLSILCELFMWLTDDTVELLNILQIPKFVDLQPTPAHRYIAFLAREGLVEEVITTNYDTCMEKAFQATFNGSPLSHPCRQSPTETHDRDDDLVKQYEPCLVITNLNQYRKWSGKTFFEHQRLPRRSLRVYKINGCACHYRYVLANERNDSTRRSAAETILLTERQLQHWRERHWARDLFRDRLRSRTLLFSGFGSAEPQVAHTVMQIVEEFERITGDHANTEQSERWYKLPNAPFVTAYDTDLSFQQVQILYSYARAHHNSTKSSLGDPIDPHASAITGSSASFFHGQPETGGTRTNGGENKLPADLS